MEMYNKLPSSFRFVIGAVVLYYLFKLILPTIRGISNTIGSAGSSVSKKVETTALSVTSGLTASEVDLCRNVANAVGNALNIGKWNGYLVNDDEDEAIRQLNRLTTSKQAQLTSKVFDESFGKSLAYVIGDELNTSEKMKIKSVIYNNIY